MIQFLSPWLYVSKPVDWDADTMMVSAVIRQLTKVVEAIVINGTALLVQLIVFACPITYWRYKK